MIFDVFGFVILTPDIGTAPGGTFKPRTFRLRNKNKENDVNVQGK